MQGARYAVVAYVRNPVGEFVENLRRELLPGVPCLPAHLTIMPPRVLKGSEGAALEVVEEACREASPFEVTMGDVETFVPVTPTVFIRVAHAAYRMRELHDRLNRGILEGEEQWPYMPHLTIAKLSEESEAQRIYEVAHERWHEFHGSRSIYLGHLTFVREKTENSWIDLAPVPLGGSLVSGPR
jgi:2'-5' RNA ligase